MFPAEDSEYIRAIGPRYRFHGRPHLPAWSQVDHMLVLEGPQGKRNRRAATLVKDDAWFTDRLSRREQRCCLEIAGVQLVSAEMDALRKRHRPPKSFSPAVDRSVRLRQAPVSLPRQCVFAATINPIADGYLKDPTGARRFWPVACRGMIDRDGLENARDLLWAEAVHRFKARAPWWLETPQLEALATVEQSARFESLGGTHPRMAGRPQRHQSLRGA
jgi:predicted P-loop ATPase